MDDFGNEVNKNIISKQDLNEKITICHKGKVTISISIDDLQDHLDHGDKIGPCGSTYVPDDNFEQALIDFGYDDILDDFVLTENIENIGSLYVNSRDIQAMTGIEDFLNLKILHCRSNRISQLDVSKNVNLITLYCDNNQLSELSVSNNLLLQNLFCYKNEIEELDLSSNTDLLRLNCYGNDLIKLNLKNVAGLLILSTVQNQTLECIQVDSVEDFESNPLYRTDGITTFSLDCGY
jgi:Leucine-rich repeat (LRR) protein